MKKLLFLALTLFCVGGLSMEAQTQPGGKILVAYFSWSGNAKALAQQIAQETGGTLFEIKTVKRYSDNYSEHKMKELYCG
jgi:hypothetical protein